MGWSRGWGVGPGADGGWARGPVGYPYWWHPAEGQRGGRLGYPRGRGAPARDACAHGHDAHGLPRDLARDGDGDGPPHVARLDAEEVRGGAGRGLLVRGRGDVPVPRECAQAARGGGDRDACDQDQGPGDGQAQPAGCDQPADVPPARARAGDGRHGFG